MLLSRAMNRGYAAGRARWPLEFGFLNNDCFWVFDEIQLMSTGLATSLQLDAWRDTLLLRPTSVDFPKTTRHHAAKPCASLWMSATMARHWLKKAVDWEPQAEKEWDRRERLGPEERSDVKLRTGQLFDNGKRLDSKPIAKLEKPRTKDNKVDKPDADRKQRAYMEQFAAHIRKNRAQSGLTLVIVNTVDRATALFQLLTGANQPNVEIRLIHSRFRPMERKGWRDVLHCRDAAPRILISTQVVEAGVDLSASVLYTELAPWASLVQRFGRCARYPGESGVVYWLDLDLGTEKQAVNHWARPYGRAELTAARQRLEGLTDVGLQSLSEIMDPALFPYDPRFVPRDKDLFDLFDTTPDLTGADIDVSRFIRDGDEHDVQVFWRKVSQAGPERRDRPDREELCPVAFYRFREVLPELAKAGKVWRRNYRKGWETIDTRDADTVFPGQVYLLERSCGGYDTQIGWTGNPKDSDFELPATVTPPSKESSQDDDEDSDGLSRFEQNQWLTVLQHTNHVCLKLDEIMRDCDCLQDREKYVLRLAVRWHDRGKAHPVFQSKIELTDDAVQKLGGQPAAKAPDSAWRKNGIRPGFRHELASALAILETLRQSVPSHDAFAWPDGLVRPKLQAAASSSANNTLLAELADLSPDELDLLMYLVAAHHGKVRMSIRSSPDDDRTDVSDACPEDKRQARGVRDDDSLPPCEIPASDLKTSLSAPEVTLNLDLMELGLSEQYGASWRERMSGLLERIGPFRLSFLEGLLRAADCRASEEEDKLAAVAGVEG
jgi:CRISPR-associated endonuclease/helicase Cas3